MNIKELMAILTNSVIPWFIL